MKVVIFDTVEKQVQGLQHKTYVERNTLFIFPLIEQGVLFHSQNVPEDFDIAFLDKDFNILQQETLKPPTATTRAPAGTFMAMESRGGAMKAWGFVPGKKAVF